MPVGRLDEERSLPVYGRCTLYSLEGCQRAVHAHKLPGALGKNVRGETFAKQSQNLHIHLQMNSTTAVTYINRMGGTHSSTLSNMACSLWQWCLQRGITLSAEHLPGVHNTTVDAESRPFHSSAEWQLLPSVFKRINTLLRPCQVDLLATKLNHQLPHYISWRPDPSAMSTDVFQGKWTGFLRYAFPPFALVGKCLQKVRREKCSLLIVAPVWASQAWYQFGKLPRGLKVNWNYMSEMSECDTALPSTLHVFAFFPLVLPFLTGGHTKSSMKKRHSQGGPISGQN